MSTVVSGAPIESPFAASIHVAETSNSAATALPFDIDIPLIVDLDGTLFATDLLHEGLVQIAVSEPFAIPGVLLSILRGRAALKAAVFEKAQLDVTNLPLHADLVKLIRIERSAGRQVHLITAANVRQAEAVAKALQLFDETSGSTPEVNLKGLAKLQTIKSRFGAHFIYAGDAWADEPIFRAASGAILVGPAAARQADLTIAGVRVAGVMPRVNRRDAWLRLLRIRQWSKNILIGAPLFLSQQVTDAGALATTAAAFFLFSLLASGTYVINDIYDLPVDRQHPTKRNRPLAAGTIGLGDALLVASALIVFSLLTAAALLPPAFTAVLVSYLLLTLAYTIAIKQTPLADANVIGILFTLRIVAGMAVLGQPISLWLTSFSATLFTSFALAKRQTEFARIAADGSSRRTGRGYQVEDLPAVLALGVSYAMASMLIMLLYFHFEAAGKDLYQTVEWLYVIPALLMLWVSRIWLFAHRGVLHDDPIEFALQDAVSWWYAAAVILIWGLAVFY